MGYDNDLAMIIIGGAAAIGYAVYGVIRMFK